MQFLLHEMVQHRESVPQDIVSNTIYCDRFPYRSLWISTYASCDEVVTAVKTVGVDLTLSRFQQMSDTVMYSIELSLTVEGTTFEYDCYLHTPD